VVETKNDRQSPPARSIWDGLSTKSPREDQTHHGCNKDTLVSSWAGSTPMFGDAGWGVTYEMAGPVAKLFRAAWRTGPNSSPPHPTSTCHLYLSCDGDQVWSECGG